MTSKAKSNTKSKTVNSNSDTNGNGVSIIQNPLKGIKATAIKKLDGIKSLRIEEDKDTNNYATADQIAAIKILAIRKTLLECIQSNADLERENSDLKKQLGALSGEILEYRLLKLKQASQNIQNDSANLLKNNKLEAGVSITQQPDGRWVLGK